MTDRSEPDAGLGPPHQSPAPRELQFVVTLTPHRSLSRRGFLVLMGAVSAVAFGTGIAFSAMGAWPVLGFCGLDVLLVYWAFRANFAAARSLEVVELKGHELTVTQTPHRGQPVHTAFNPAWVRIQVEELAGEVCQLRLGEGRRSVIVGGFLGDDERRSLAAYLNDAIAAYRAGRAMPV